MQLEFDIYPGRANSIKLALTNNGTALADHTALTRLGLYVGSTLYDSDTEPTLFDLTQPDAIEIKLGAADPALAVGRYSCTLVVYDAGDYAGGYIWPEKFIATIKNEPD